VDGLIAEQAKGERRADNPTLDDLAEMFCEWSSKTKEARTAQGHSERLTTFAKFAPSGGVPYGDRAIRDLQATDLSRFIKAFKSQGYSPGYINSIVLSVMACFNWAVAPIEDRIPERLLTLNPFAGVRRPKNPAPPKRYAGSEARRAFLVYARRRACSHKVGTLARRFERLVIELLRFAEATGCRPSEACRLEWQHIDWEGARAKLKGKSTHKTGKDRVLPLTASILRSLRAIERLPGRHERYVFTHRGEAGTKEEPNLAGLPWNGHALAQKIRLWRTEAIEQGYPIAAKGAAALTASAYRRDMGADVLRMTKSHAASAEVLGHSVAVNERHYSSFAEEYAVELARGVAEARKALRADSEASA